MKSLQACLLMSAVLAAGLLSSGEAHAKRRPQRPAVTAPELSGSTGATGAVVLLGAAAMFASRRRRSA